MYPHLCYSFVLLYRISVKKKRYRSRIERKFVFYLKNRKIDSVISVKIPFIRTENPDIIRNIIGRKGERRNVDFTIYRFIVFGIWKNFDFFGESSMGDFKNCMCGSAASIGVDRSCVCGVDLACSSGASDSWSSIFGGTEVDEISENQSLHRTGNQKISVTGSQEKKR